jgi:hypothetical protein
LSTACRKLGRSAIETFFYLLPKRASLGRALSYASFSFFQEPASVPVGANAMSTAPRCNSNLSICILQVLQKVANVRGADFTQEIDFRRFQKIWILFTRRFIELIIRYCSKFPKIWSLGTLKVLSGKFHIF